MASVWRKAKSGMKKSSKKAAIKSESHQSGNQSAWRKYRKSGWREKRGVKKPA